MAMRPSANLPRCHNGHRELDGTGCHFSWRLRVLLSVCAVLPLVSPLEAAEYVVRTAAELRIRLGKLAAGDVLKVAPGTYPGGMYVKGIARLTVEALDPEKPPLIEGGKTGWHFTECPQLTLRHIHLHGQSINGLDVDEGGADKPLVEGVLIEGVHASDIGPNGNHDGIKLSGLRDAVIKDCVVIGWGGQAIDLVGCHDIRITGCRIVGKLGYNPPSGVQIKGGSSNVVVEECRFERAGERPVNIGGSTGLPYFRPRDATYEARNITVRRNHIEGSWCAAAFVGVDGAVFEDNTVLFPGRWIFRILQENRNEGFVPCRNGMIRGNRIVFRRADILEDVNQSDGVAAGTFRFENNHWFAADRPASSKPRLPVQEIGGVYRVDPHR